MNQNTSLLLLRAIMENITDAVVAIDMDLRLLAFNPIFVRRFTAAFGKQPTIGISLLEALSDLPAESAHVVGLWRRALAGETFTVVRECGKPHLTGQTSETTYTCLRDDEGQILGAMHISRDVASTIAADRERARLTAIVESTSDFVGTATPDGKLLYCNQAFRDFLGVTEEQVSTLTVRNLYLPAAWEEVKDDLIASTERDGQWSGESVYLSGDGREVPVSLKVFVHKDEQGVPLYRSAIVRDISELKAMEAMLRQVQKMDSIGRLAGGIAHDFNNLLAVIMGYAEIVAESLPENDALYSDIQNIRNAATRAASLTQQLLAFARKQAITPQILYPNDVLQKMVTMLDPLIGEAIDRVSHLDPDIGTIYMDANQLEQVILNLVVNARDAMPQGGWLVLRTEPVIFYEDMRHEQVRIPAGRYVCLSVSDTGVGMTAEVKERIFEPFFTTKEKGKGTGLGLATVYGIVKQNRGFVWAVSEVGVGTTFRVWLPCTESAIARQETNPTSISRPDLRHTPDHDARTVLVAEDEPMLLQLTATALRAHGYRVLETANGVEALAVAEKHPGKIHLLVTDAIMPQMGGVELVRRLRATRPEIPVLMVSGYSEEMFTNESVSCDGNGVQPLLQKPFTISDLLTTMRELL